MNRIFCSEGPSGREPHFQGEVSVPEEREKIICSSLCFPAMDLHQRLGKYYHEEKKPSFPRQSLNYYSVLGCKDTASSTFPLRDTQSNLWIYKSDYSFYCP